MKKFFKNFMALGITAGALLATPACTKLDEKVYSQIEPSNFFSSEKDFVAGVVPVYAALRSYQNNNQYYGISQVTSDETVVPTRGGDWGDNGNWRFLHQHNWTAQHPFFNDFWSGCYAGVFRANFAIEAISKADDKFASKKQFLAEAKVLRAFFYYQLMDFFGGVPLYETATLTAEQEQSPRKSRQEIFEFIENELKNSLPDLKEANELPSSRVSKGVANALLAKLYLNAGVYVGTPRWQDAVNACDAVINSGKYTLAANFFDNFSTNNETSPENIFTIGNLNQDGLGHNISMMNLHYTQLPQGPWNGFCVVTEYYDSFDTLADARAKMFLKGFQTDFEGKPANDRQGKRLFFTVQIPSLTNAEERTGVRVLKFELDRQQVGGNARNDFPILRFADVLLMKAEALNELRGPNAESIDLINRVRARAFNPAKPVSLGQFGTREVLRAYLLRERGYELGWEAHRRNDQIRMGTFTTGTWVHKAVSPATRTLFPIPQARLDTNPNLTQNPGY